MNNILTLSIFIFLSYLNFGNPCALQLTNKSEYQKNLEKASELYLAEKKIPETILLELVPENYTEFNFYYGTTEPNHILGNTNFFYESTRLIFEEVTSKNNNDFYIPSLKLISFADGEYAEKFIKYLKLIIDMDKQKFCKTIKGKEFVEHNPLKYYSELNKCE